ncbi:MAG TPA: cupin domain-containing protein, partial [Solirubrobacteraceae bacterium]
ASGEKFLFAGAEASTWDGALTNGQYALNALTFFKGWESPMHIHHFEDEGIYIFSGAMATWLRDEPYKVVRAGEFVFLPRGVPHAGRVLEDGTHALGIFTPPGFDRFMRESSLDFTPGDFTVEKAIEGAMGANPRERYGIEILGPIPKTA